MVGREGDVEIVCGVKPGQDFGGKEAVDKEEGDFVKDEGPRPARVA